MAACVNPFGQHAAERKRSPASTAQLMAGMLFLLIPAIDSGSSGVAPALWLTPQSATGFLLVNSHATPPEVAAGALPRAAIVS